MLDAETEALEAHVKRARAAAKATFAVFALAAATGSPSLSSALAPALRKACTI